MKSGHDQSKVIFSPLLDNKAFQQTWERQTEYGCKMVGTEPSFLGGIFPMDDQELRKLIEQLHAEIKNTHTVDKKGQELLTHLESDIQELLDRTEGNVMPVHPSTIQRLEEGLSHFEATHPSLTALLSRFLDALSNVGI